MNFRIIFKFYLITAILFLFTFVSTDATFASSNQISKTGCRIAHSDSNVFKESKVIRSLNGNKVFEITDSKKVAKYSNAKVEPQNEKLVGFAISYTNFANAKSQFGAIKPKWGSGYYIKNIASGEVCGIEVIRSSLYKGPAMATMTISEAIATQFVTGTGISAEVVSAKLGFNVTKTYTVSDTYSINVPKGKTYKIIAHPIFIAYNFEVWYDPLLGSDYQVGTGDVLKPIGVCFYYYSL
jgi:hypothetical protein